MVQVKHGFTSGKADGGDPTQVQPSHWNADHTVTVSATQKILVRKSAGSGAVEEGSISETLDFLSSTRGVVAYRGASGWQALAPGTATQVLTTNGAGADPTWATVTQGRNRIINGQFFINQYAGHGVDTTPASTAYVQDRWYIGMSQASKITYRTVANDYAGSPSTLTPYYGRLTVASAVSVGAADNFFLGQHIEGTNVSDLAWGTTNARPITVSFWALSSISGTFCFSVRNAAGNRSYVQTFALTGGTPSQVVITIPGDTSGTWANDLSTGIRACVSLGCGSNYNTTAGAWQAGNFLQSSAQTQWIANAGATFKITEVQLEPGALATPFERRLVGPELTLCQRYYQTSNNTEYFIFPAPNSTFAATFRVSYPVVMRAAASPVVSYSYTSALSSIATQVYTPTQFTLLAIANANTNGYAYFTWTVSAEL